MAHSLTKSKLISKSFKMRSSSANIFESVYIFSPNILSTNDNEAGPDFYIIIEQGK